MRIASFLVALVLGAGVLVPGTSSADARAAVRLDPDIKAQFLANMRDYMAVVDQAIGGLATEDFGPAAEAMEQRMGMSSMADPRMKRMMMAVPDSMRALGRSMHQAASRFAVKAEEGSRVESLRALREVTQTCVACHAAFRLE